MAESPCEDQLSSLAGMAGKHSWGGVGQVAVETQPLVQGCACEELPL